MILIVGGCFQGKASYGRRLAKQLAAAGGPAGIAGGPVRIADGASDPPAAAVGCGCLLNFHGFIRQAMEAGEDPDEYTGRVLEAGPWIVTMDEVGCGIVPAERWERDYREAVGRAGQRLAAAAGTVVRMTAGIPVMIKDDGEDWERLTE